MRKVIADQQKVLESLERRLDETDQKLNATADQVDVNAEESVFSHTSIGGYGELHYNNYEDKDAKVDFHRFVLFFGHEFSDSIRFFSEFELEHSLAGDDKPGEVELEQAYVEVDINEGLKPQTIEALDILKQYKTPFIIAVNKIDIIQGWMDFDGPLIAKLNKQSQTWTKVGETKLYE